MASKGMIKVITTGRLSTQFYAHFKDNALGVEVRCTEHLTQAQIDWADCLASFPVDENVSLEQLKWVHSFGAGVDGFLKRTDLGANLRLSRTTGTLGAKAGEFCLCHILNFLQDTFSIYEDMQSQAWRERSATSLKRKTVLILGTGSMAQGIAAILSSLNMTVLGVNTSGTSSHKSFAHCYRLETLPSALGHVSCVINTLPDIKATQGLLDATFFKRFQHALLINIGRGPTLNTEDLHLALEAEHLHYCVLDVFDEEPLTKTSWLWGHHKVFISPHQAAITDINDVTSSFVAALQGYSSNTPNNHFVDRRKSY